LLTLLISCGSQRADLNRSAHLAPSDQEVSKFRKTTYEDSALF